MGQLGNLFCEECEVRFHISSCKCLKYVLKERLLSLSPTV